ncbi:hypothetical protein ACQ4N7_28970 [Nodosilinea sp. AN01ver1]|uniref:hypothetical protein n=1 Tax=Nodosilinea sp. AN01ver1 TaxID=3423362 RepID=UPI003D3245FF
MNPKDKIKISGWVSAFVVKADRFMITAIEKESGQRISVAPSEIKWHSSYKDLNIEDRALVDGFKIS